MASKETDARLRIAGGLVIIVLTVISLVLFRYPPTGDRAPGLGILSIVAAVVQFGVAVIVMVGRTRAGRLVLTRRRWKFFALAGIVVLTIVPIMVTQPNLDRAGPGLALFPILIAGFIAQLYQPEGSAQFNPADLSDRDARGWNKISLALLLIGVSVGAVAGIGAAAGNIFALPLLLPIAVLSLIFAGGIRMMLRTRNR